MSPETVFNACNLLAMVAWLFLIVTGSFWMEVDKFMICVVIVLLAVVYSWLIFSAFKRWDIQSFGSLDQVMNLFKDPTMVTAGWVHYLAFDLMTGTWITRNASKLGIRYWLIIPCQLLTFMFGPMGLLVYLLIRWAVTKRYFAPN
jgi:hypothetical protein